MMTVYKSEGLPEVIVAVESALFMSNKDHVILPLKQLRLRDAIRFEYVPIL